MATPVAGSLTWLVAQGGLLVVQWDLDLSQAFQPTLTREQWIAPDVGTALVVNPGDYANVWVQVLLSTVVTVREGQTLEAIAKETGSEPGALLALNRLAGPVLEPGQRLLVTAGFPAGGLSSASYVIGGP